MVSYTEFIMTLQKLGLHEESVVFASENGTTLSMAFSRLRYTHIVRVRHRVMWLVRTRAGWSYPAIGRLFNVDHSTAMMAVRRIQLQTDGFVVPCSESRKIRLAVDGPPNTKIRVA